MKYLGFLIAVNLFCGCASTMNKEVLDRYVGKVGYFSIAPKFAEAAQTLAYKPCESVEITSIKKFNAVRYVNFKQGSTLFELTLFNQEGDTDIEFLKNSFVESIDLPIKKIKLKDKTLTEKDLICSSSHYTGMHKKHFLMIRGLPIKINRTTGVHGVSEQYIYTKIGDYYGLSHEKDYFYFTDNILTSWQDTK